MANEITVTARLKVAKSNLKDDRNDTITANMSGTRRGASTQTIGTTYEAVTMPPDIGTAGYAFFKNQDATNYVEIGLEVAATFYGFVKLKPGECCVLRLATNSIFARANTAACDLEMVVLQD